MFARVSRPLALLLAVALAPACFAAAATTVLPPGATVPGWKMLGQARTYNSSNLYDLVDGEAEAILQYDFRSCVHGEYAPSKSSTPVLTIDVYDMGSPLNAFGMFGNSDRMSGKAVKLGVEGVQIGSSGVNFWKDRFVVRTTLVGRNATTAANQAVQMKFAAAAVKRISGASAVPAEVRALPAGYRAGSQRYVRKNVAGQKSLSNAVVARYPSAGMSAELFIAKYPSAAGAKNALAAFKAYEKKGSGLAALKGVGNEGFSVKDPYSGTVVAARKGAYVVGVIRGKDVDSATALVKKAVARL